MSEEKASGEAGNPSPAGRPADEGLTSEERQMLSALSGGAAPPQAPASSAAPAAVTESRTPEAAEAPPVAPRGELTSEEEKVLRQAREEADSAIAALAATAGSERLAQGGLQPWQGEPAVARPQMLDQDKTAPPAPALPPRGGGHVEWPLGAETLEPAVPPLPHRESAFEQSRLGRTLAAPLEVVNLPFRWMSPVVRLGLGLAGVLLLITLLLVILVRMLRGA